jgi:hypothetical protein
MTHDHDPQKRRERIVRAQGRPWPEQVQPDRAMALWGLIRDCLTPILGARGVDALLARALTLTGASYPWLCEGRKLDPDLDTFATLRTCLGNRSSLEATEANHALIVTFTELLASFIGNSLTDRLLDPVWAAGASATQEDTP